MASAFATPPAKATNLSVFDRGKEADRVRAVSVVWRMRPSASKKCPSISPTAARCRDLRDLARLHHARGQVAHRYRPCRDRQVSDPALLARSNTSFTPRWASITSRSSPVLAKKGTGIISGVRAGFFGDAVHHIIGLAT